MNALSVDVEDWFQVWALSECIQKSDWDNYPLRVGDSTRRLLDLFDAHGAKATFFSLSWVAERCPDLLKEIADRGHEIGSHGVDHEKVFDLSDEAFRADVVESKHRLEDITGQAVIGYRAPGFSIDKRTPNAYGILQEAGYLYSSSSHPISHDHYGDPTAPICPYNPVPGLAELPVAVRDSKGRRRSCAGGGWFRILPYQISQKGWQELESEGRPGIFYLHPWEVDPGQPIPKGVGLKSLLRHRINLGRMEDKLARLLSDFQWDRIDSVFATDIHPSQGEDAA